MYESNKRPALFKEGWISTKRIQYVLFGILFILVSLISVFDRTGFVGKIFSFVFIYLFGSTYIGIMAIILGLGIYYLVKQDKLIIKWNVSSIFFFILVLFVLVAFGDASCEGNTLLSEVFAKYGEAFNKAISSATFKEFASSGIGGGIIGRFIFSLLSTLLTPVGARVVYVLAIVAGLFFVLKPIAYSLGNNFFAKKDRAKARDERERAEKQRKFSEYFDERERGFFNKDEQNYRGENNIEVEDIDEVATNRTFKTKKTANPNSFNVFKTTNKIFDDNNTSRPLRTNNPIPTSSGKKFDVFHDVVIDDEVVSKSIKNEVPHALNREDFIPSEGNTQGGVFVPYPKYKPTSKIEVPEINVEPEIESFNPLEEEVEETNENISVTTKTADEHFVEENSPTFDDNLFIDPVKEAQTTISSKTVQKRKGTYKLPSVDLLNDPVDVDNESNIKEARINEAKLNNKFESLGLNAKVVDFVVAPAFTQYRVEVGESEKLSQFNSIKQDLMMSLSALSINVLCPIPGTSYVGIEVPNKVRTAVSFKEILCDSSIASKKDPLLVALGKDTIGKTISMKLNSAPHLLIAGTTGSGKSVCINTIITSIIMRKSPEEVRFLMVDPKTVELKVYNEIPHLICPVVTDATHAKVAFQKAIDEMEKRFIILNQGGYRNVDSYNEDAEANGLPKLPYIVIVVDELYDLMVQSKHEIEDSIGRLAAKARAAGMHIIVATQHPSINVISGNIKANFPSRIAFAVTTNADSRVILDEIGAESLLGKGDMLLALQGSTRQRVQGAFIDEDEVSRICEYLRNMRSPDYYPEFMDLEPKQTMQQQSIEGNFGRARDERFDDVLDFIKDKDSVSTSGISRQFGFGFPRASAIIDRLEREGLVGPMNGIKGRTVFKDKIEEYLKGDNSGN